MLKAFKGHLAIFIYAFRLVHSVRNFIRIIYVEPFRHLSSTPRITRGWKCARRAVSSRVNPLVRQAHP